jgi:hypothetical protein
MSGSLKACGPVIPVTAGLRSDWQLGRREVEVRPATVERGDSKEKFEFNKD